MLNLFSHDFLVNINPKKKQQPMNWSWPKIVNCHAAGKYLNFIAKFSYGNILMRFYYTPFQYLSNSAFDQKL